MRFRAVADPLADPSAHTGPLYVFGYGSLMWSPGFVPSAIHPARVFGWHRRFSRVSVTSWGSPDRPGLCAALHARGTAWGRILEIPAEGRADIVAYLDQRERAYLRRPVRVDALVGGGLRRLAVFTYVANPADPTLAATLEPELARKYARHGVGTKGAAYDYVRSTMAALIEDGHARSDAHRFFAMIAG